MESMMVLTKKNGNNSLHIAVKLQNIDIIKEILELYKNFNYYLLY